LPSVSRGIRGLRFNEAVWAIKGRGRREAVKPHLEKQQSLASKTGEVQKKGLPAWPLFSHLQIRILKRIRKFNWLKHFKNAYR